MKKHGHCIYDFKRAEEVRESYRLPGATHKSTGEKHGTSRALAGRIVSYKVYAKE